jgi:WD40 repeat protein
MFASASSDNSIRIWNQNTFECIKILKGHTKGVDILIAVRNEYLISVSKDQSIIVWDIKNNFLIITTTKTDVNLYSLALFSNDSFITGDYDGSIKMWSTSQFTFKNENTLKGHTDSVSDLVFLNNGYLVSTSFDKTIKIWDNSFNLWFSAMSLLLASFSRREAAISYPAVRMDCAGTSLSFIFGKLSTFCS